MQELASSIIPRVKLTLQALNCGSFFLQYPETMACSSDLIGVEEKCFCCSNDTRDWIASNRFCSSWGSEYAHIDTQKDMEFLKMCTGTAMHWVGLSRRLGEPWKWTNCTTLNDG
nr:C-type lectin domain family 2 member A-like [Oryctolagus cuniculus]